MSMWRKYPAECDAARCAAWEDTLRFLQENIIERLTMYLTADEVSRLLHIIRDCFDNAIFKKE